MADLQNILVPDVGGEEVEIIEICLSVGDSVEAEEAFVTVESDKSSMDIPVPFDCVIKEISVAVGDKIKEGDLLGKAESGASGSASSSEAAEKPAEAPAKEAPSAPAEQASSSQSGSSTIEVVVPDIGGDTDVEIIELLVSAGDTVSEEDGLITLETDKATMDVPAPQAGKVVEMKVSVGDKVSEGSLVLILEVAGSGGDSADSAPAPAPAAEASSQAAPAPSGEPSVVEVKVPDIGGDTDVDIIEVLVKEGDEINEEDGLITLETDKATMDVPAPSAGKVVSVKVKVGDKVSEGSLVLTMEVAGSASASAPAASAPAASSAPAPAAQSAQKAPPVPHHPSAGEIKPTGRVHASPSVRRLAREFGVDLAQVSGERVRKVVS